MTIASKILLLVVAIATALGFAQPASAAQQRGTEHLEFEVSEDMYRFSFDEEPRFDDGLPAYGNAFITEGYIYPAGTLNGSNGVLADGSPEFPEKVIGHWKCWGYFVGDGARTTEGAWVATTQLFEFGDGPAGSETLVTVGVESVIGEPSVRAVVGGTGRYASARGSVTQTLVGFNTTEGVVAEFDFSLTDVARAGATNVGETPRIAVGVPRTLIAA